MKRKNNFLKKVIGAVMAVVTILSMNMSAFAVVNNSTVADATIDMSATGSITLYKYDITNAEKDGVWDSSYISTGQADDSVTATLGGTAPAGASNIQQTLGNGQSVNGYAIKGVEFSYARIAELEQYSKVEDGQEKIIFLYKVPKTLAQTPVSLTDGEANTTNKTLLAILGLSATAGDANGPYKADAGNTGYLYFESDKIIDAFNALLEDHDPNNEELSYLNNSATYNPSVTKTLLEQWIQSSPASILNKGTFPLTDSNGRSAVTDLPLGLYMVVETAVPEMVTDTTIPFLISLPMTNVNGGNVTNGGTNWVYDVTVYPKNLTGYPSLEKTVREARMDSGLNDGRTISDTIADNAGVIADGFAHNATASSGDTLQFQILSTIPAITSAKTYLKEYTFDDELSKGLTYKKNDVQIEIFSDALCTSRVTTWGQTDSPAKFTVTYASNAETGGESMKIELTEAGKLELNTSKAVFTSDTRVNSGYSDCTMRITYEATLDADSSAVMGDAGNDNRVTLTWRRTSSETEDYYDKLVDDTHVFTYALNLTKQFSGSHDSRDYDAVKFILHNDDDNYYVKVQKLGDYYYVIGHLYDENDTDATHANASGDAEKSAVNKDTAPDNDAVILTPILNDPDRDDDEMCIVIRGLEPNNYTLTEIATADGYTLLKDSIKITITATPTNEGSGNATKVCNIYSTDELGTVQNDPRRAYYEGGVNFKGGANVTKPTIDVFGNTIAFSTNDLNTETNAHQAGTVHRVVQEGQVSLEHPKLIGAAYVTNSTTSRDNATIDDQATEVSMITELVGVTKYGSDGKIENSVTNLGGINHIEVNGTTASTNAIVPLTVVNTRGFNLPKTGENGNWLFPAIGITVACGAMFALYMAFRKKGGKGAKQASTEA